MFNGVTYADFNHKPYVPITTGYIMSEPAVDYKLITNTPEIRPALAVKLDDERLMPKRAHRTDAGADLFSKEKHIIYPNEMAMVDTGVAVRIPEGFVGLVYSRSGQGKMRIHLANSVGVIDSDYRGPIKVIIVNEGDDPYEIHPFITKIAQLVVTPIMLCDFYGYAGNEEDWMDTTRGSGGFGSTN